LESIVSKSFYINEYINIPVADKTHQNIKVLNSNLLKFFNMNCGKMPMIGIMPG